MKNLFVVLACVAALSSACSKKETNTSSNSKASTPAASNQSPAQNPETTPPTPAAAEEQSEETKAAIEEITRDAAEISEHYTDIDLLLDRASTETVLVFNESNHPSMSRHDSRASAPRVTPTPRAPIVHVTPGTEYPAGCGCGRESVTVERTPTPVGVTAPAPTVANGKHADCPCGENCCCDENCGCGCDFEAIQRKQFSERKQVPGHSREGFDNRGRQIPVPPVNTDPHADDVIEPVASTPVTKATFWNSTCRRSEWSFAQSKDSVIISTGSDVTLVEKYYKVAGEDRQLSHRDGGISCNPKDLLFTIKSRATNIGASNLEAIRLGERQKLDLVDNTIFFSQSDAARDAAIRLADQIVQSTNYVGVLVERDNLGAMLTDYEIGRLRGNAIGSCLDLAVAVKNSTDTWEGDTFDLNKCRYFDFYTYVQRSSGDTLMISESSSYESHTRGNVSRHRYFMDGRHPDQISRDMNYDYFFTLHK